MGVTIGIRTKALPLVIPFTYKANGQVGFNLIIMKPKLVINIEHIVCIATYEGNGYSEKYTDFMLVGGYQYDTMAYDILIEDGTTYLSEYIKNI